jgi:hypothetical protein
LAQVNKLESTLKDVFGFTVETKLLDHKQKPQLQMNKHISGFICDYDDDNTLLIIYYAGHGYSALDPERKLILHG